MKNSRNLIIVGAIVVGAIAILGGCQKVGNQQTPTPVPTQKPTTEVTTQPGKDPKNATYIIEGKSVTLINGTASTPAAPGSATMVTTTMFGEPTKGELTGDANNDYAVMLTQNSGGSATFFYEAAALNKNNQYIGTNAILLGDRIAPQTTQVMDQTITVNFAERKPDEPMTAKPSVGVSKYFQVKDGVLVEIEK
jgi:hypothetical protein